MHNMIKVVNLVRAQSKVYLSMGLHQLRERMKFGQRYLSEKVALSFNVFARYGRQILYIFTDFQVSERLH